MKTAQTYTAADAYQAHHASGKASAQCARILAFFHTRGGSHEDANLVTACFKCNRSKRAKLVEEWRAA